MNRVDIVQKGMLAWKRNKITLYTGSTDKECMIVVEMIEGIFKPIEIRSRDGVVVHNAFELLPVHCKKSWPSGKCRSPRKVGIAEILQKDTWN